MFALIKRILIFLSLVTIAAIIGIFFYTYNRTYYNDVNFIGNTTGNIYNGGLFCELNGKIYFSNDSDNGSLYVMNSDITNIQKIHSDKVAYINADENYLYYIRTNNMKENTTGNVLTFNNTGIYRINHDGKNLKLITGKPGSYLTLQGNYLYFQRYDVSEGLQFYRNKIDASEERKLVNDAVTPITVIDNKLYYSGFSKEHNINTIDLSSFTTRTRYEGNFAYPIIKGSYIYYINLDDKYKIYRMNLDGTNPTVLVKDRCSTYNISNSGKSLYYQVDDKKNSRIAVLNLDTMESEVIQTGNFKQINVTDYFVFFKDFNNTTTFLVTADGSTKLRTFEAPIPKQKK